MVKMPIYKYICKECGNKIEDFFQMDSDNPECDCGSQMIRDYSNSRVGIIFKGENFTKSKD